MEGKRLDLDAPLLSFRRITAPAACEKAAQTNRLRRKALSVFSSKLTSGLGGSVGTVPFDWEKTPGQPKDSSVTITSGFGNLEAPKLPPGRSRQKNGTDGLKGASMIPESETIFRTPMSITCSSDDRNEKAKLEDEEEAYFTERVDEDEAFSDARDAFSCAESFSMKCSMSGGAGVWDNSKSLTKDPQVKDFMMDRFLPAAQAMAADSLQRPWRKPPRAPVVDCENSDDHSIKSRLPLDYQYQLRRAQLHGAVQEEEDVEEEYDGDENYAGSGLFSSKAFGLIHRLCLGSSFGLSIPGPGTKAQGKPMPVIHNKPSPQTEVLRHSSLGQTKDEDSWEAVYRHKLRHGCYPHKGDERKLSESNQLTSWSDSQMLDCSSFLNSTVSALSPDKHEDPKEESGCWKRGSPDSCEKDYRSYCETTYSDEKLQGSGSMSPANKRLFNLQETPDCKYTESMPSGDTKAIVESSGNSSSGNGAFHQTEETVVSESSEGHPLQSRSFKLAEPGLNCIKVDGNDLDNDDDSDNGLALKVSLLEKNDDSLALSLLPPPLPTSPSESWLQRTLPSVSSNGQRPHQRSFLGIHLHPNKQISRASAYGEPSNMQPRRARFAEVAKDA